MERLGDFDWRIEPYDEYIKPLYGNAQCGWWTKPSECCILVCLFVRVAFWIQSTVFPKNGTGANITKNTPLLVLFAVFFFRFFLRTKLYWMNQDMLDACVHLQAVRWFERAQIEPNTTIITKLTNLPCVWMAFFLHSSFFAGVKKLLFLFWNKFWWTNTLTNNHKPVC